MMPSKSPYITSKRAFWTELDQRRTTRNPNISPMSTTHEPEPPQTHAYPQGDPPYETPSGCRYLYADYDRPTNSRALRTRAARQRTRPRAHAPAILRLRPLHVHVCVQCSVRYPQRHSPTPTPHRYSAGPSAGWLANSHVAWLDCYQSCCLGIPLFVLLRYHLAIVRF
ncbi:hypothetical protein K491DRAFT_147147 [Lophiostoma macrostomum CBS 122681]|uniref:Uncharacterized protein n=1 Tax=Lophiostoma macrostomum CBS 122681 TaxID=1314788 RepID=A0A6A6SQR4_9PLEO|nr:hypothetical protein K491DRAFT_147147 [Lophiostoma macrostomum CBS 122681]